MKRICQRVPLLKRVNETPWGVIDRPVTWSLPLPKPRVESGAVTGVSAVSPTHGGVGETRPQERRFWKQFQPRIVHTCAETNNIGTSEFHQPNIWQNIMVLEEQEPFQYPPFCHNKDRTILLTKWRKQKSRDQ